MAIVTITKDNFEQVVLQSDKPVLVDFWASWCGPCRMMAPVIDEIAEEQGDAIVVGKINVDDEEALAIQYGVSSIPTFMVFKNGDVAGTKIGVRPKADIESML
jgi:thioredoxin 1